jgi:hypothetical protein
MKTKIESMERSRLEGWFIASGLRTDRGARPTPPEHQPFLNAVWPMSENYYSPIRATSLLHHVAFASLNESPLWLIRDGLVPLLWFFRAFPTPRRIKTRLLVHADFAWAVPAAWRDRAGTYEIVSLPTSTLERQRNKRFILAGPFAEAVCSIKSLEASLSKLKAAVGAAALRRAELAAFLPARVASFHTDASEAYHARCLKAILDAFGTSDNVRFIDWNHLRWMDDLSGEFVEFNDRLLWADNFLVHHALSTGGRIAGDPDRRLSRSSGRIFELSPYHGFLVNFDLGRKNFVRPPFEAKRTALTGAANRSFPWHAWLSGVSSRG